MSNLKIESFIGHVHIPKGERVRGFAVFAQVHQAPFCLFDRGDVARRQTPDMT
jgi:hypothetical protein